MIQISMKYGRKTSKTLHLCDKILTINQIEVEEDDMLIVPSLLDHFQAMFPSSLDNRHLKKIQKTS